MTGERERRIAADLWLRLPNFHRLDRRAEVEIAKALSQARADALKEACEKLHEIVHGHCEDDAHLPCPCCGSSTCHPCVALLKASEAIRALGSET